MIVASAEFAEGADEGGSATAVEEPIVVTQSSPRGKADPASKRPPVQPPYNVIVLNDEDHTYEYVIELLAKLFGHPVQIAEKLTKQIDFTGRAIVMTTHKELAELKCDQVLSYGPDPRMARSRGPLGCYIEPAPTA